jgi:serine/threonine protein kinase
MEYLFGKDLRAIAGKAREREMPLGLQNALYIATRICAGLDYAHKLNDFHEKPLNIIHRDISPQNIFITYEGEVKILDFGIAKAASQSTITQMGMIKGKVAYMSPEQAAGNPIDHRSDIFSTGIVLYEMLSGKRMFQGDTMQILAKVRRAEFDPPEAVIPSLPVTLYRVLHQALAKEPSDRYQTCGEMLADLEECMVGLEIRPSARALGAYMKELFTKEIADERELMRKPEPPAPVREPERVVPPPPPPLEPTAPPPPPEPRPTPGPPVWKKVRLAPLAKIAGALVALVVVYFTIKHFIQPSPPPTPSLPVASTPAAVCGAAKALIEKARQVADVNPSEAVPLLGQAIDVDQKCAAAYHELGRVYTKLKDYPKAIEAYTKAADLDPKFPDTFFNLGYVYTVTKEYPKAEEMYVRAMNLEPSYLDDALFNLAFVQLRRGKKQDAIRNLKRALQINPNNETARKQLCLLDKKQC